MPIIMLATYHTGYVCITYFPVLTLKCILRTLICTKTKATLVAYMFPLKCVSSYGTWVG